jgi:hypothetical protein
MPFTIDFLGDGRVLEWEITADGVVATEMVARRPGFRRDATFLRPGDRRRHARSWRRSVPSRTENPQS